MRALTQLALAVAALGVWAASADAAPSAVFHGKAGLLELPGGNDVSAEGKLQKRGGIGSVSWPGVPARSPLDFC